MKNKSADKKNHWKVLFIVSLLITLFSHQSVKADRYQFKTLNVSDGLSQSTVYCILQDSRGYMWFGTRSGGLNLYDGYRFKHFKNLNNGETGNSNYEIVCLFEDSKKNIWIGTRGGGLLLYDFNKHELINFMNSNSSICSNTIHCVAEHPDGSIWIGSNGGIDIYDPHEKELTNFLLNEDEKFWVSDLYFDNDTLFAAVGNKLIQYIFNGQRITEQQLTDNLDKNVRIKSILKNGETFWLGTSKGTYLLKDGRLSLFSYQEDQSDITIKKDTRKIIKDQEGKIWLGTINGIYVIEKDQVTHLQKNNDSKSISHNSVYSLLEDQSGIIWIGTWGGGINSYKENYYKFRHYKHENYNPRSITDNVISCFAESKDGNYWVATELGGLNHYNVKKNVFEPHRLDRDGNLLFNTDHLKRISRYDENHLWVGTFGKGLFLYDHQNRNTSQFLKDKSVFAIQKVEGFGTIVGTMNGCHLIDEQFNTQVFESLSDQFGKIENNFITYLFLQNSNLWIGTKEKGAFRYNIIKKELTGHFDTSTTPSISSNYITSIEADQKGVIWISTYHGLNSVMNDDHIDHFLTNNGLPDNVTSAIECDHNGDVWVSSNSGICHFFPEKPEQSINYNYLDGLQSNEFNRGASFKLKNGTLLFGGIKGFNAFNPQKIKPNKYIPPVYITSVRLLNNESTIEEKEHQLISNFFNVDSLTLQYNESSFTINFVCLNYIQPTKNQYKYQLKGFSEQWINADESKSARYTNLDPGNYIFKVKASNNDGIWNDTGKSLYITIKSPFWKTTWAYISYIIMVSFLIFYIQKTTIIRIEEKRELAYEQKEKQRITELNKTKLQFFTDVSHDFRTPLSLISAPVEELLKMEEANPRKIYLYNTIKRNINRLMNLVDQLMDFRKLENDKYKLKISQQDLNTSLRNTFEAFADNAGRKKVNYSFIECDALAPVWFDPSVIDKIVFNLLSNAFKFVNEHGSIELKVSINNQQAMLTVKDDGIGISEDKIKHIFERYYTSSSDIQQSSGSGIGLALTKKLVELHKGSIRATSTKDTGTCFTVSFPVYKEQYSMNEFQEGKASIQTYQTIDEYTLNQTRTKSEKKGSKELVLLIVEDNPELREYLKKHFEAFTVIEAENGTEGYKSTLKKVPDIVISDIMMPEMDGIEMCRKIKNNMVSSHVPVILLTAKNAMDYRIEGTNAGADAYIAKPFDIDYLTAVTNNILEQRKKVRNKYRLLLNHNPDKLKENDNAFKKKIEALIKKNLSNPEFGVEEIGQKIGMSRSQLFRKLKVTLDITPGDLVRIVRLNAARELLDKGTHNINEIADVCGFNSSSYFITCFKRHFGKTPGEYIKNK